LEVSIDVVRKGDPKIAFDDLLLLKPPRGRIAEVVREKAQEVKEAR
jgi:hypothetical protein